MLDGINGSGNSEQRRVATREAKNGGEQAQAEISGESGAVVTGQRLSDRSAEELVGQLASRIVGNPGLAGEAHSGLDEGRVTELLEGGLTLN